MSKSTTIQEAVDRIPDGAVLMIGGFMGCGSPNSLIDELVRQDKKDLTVIANDTARPGVGIGKLISAKLVKKVIASHIGTNPETQAQMIAGSLEVDLVPQGTLAERVRAAGFGLGAVVTPTGVGTVVEDGKRTIDIGGRTFLVELPISADFALVNAKRADYRGNLSYAFTARNFNPLIAMAAAVVIAEAEDIVPVGSIEPDSVITPHVVVDYLVAKEKDNG
ncbi:3-oxoacid CoA-transferase subunit A [Telmatospirillum sp.]|uniref:CoA transferase subunit A n=1 Tax=Telmatospirillum sp. TaxID=2079197 RepID=UPI00284A4290|nr:3-oxoacid CoA-transferase subunit A [Telmatospirillum sp.]MDR3437137.1 3-oxoacid CoA-transferase subunit A [Telmatospirillum sp.]